MHEHVHIITMFFFVLNSALIGVIFGVILLKLYFNYTKVVYKCDADLSGKVILITGGNTGIGKEYVRDMARRNAKVIMACRSVKRGMDCAKEVIQETGNDKILVEKCDLASLESVKLFCELIKQREQKIDVLVCFAAAVGDNPACLDTHTKDGLQMMFQCNYLSHFLMIHLLMDLLKQSEQGRVILTSSGVHLIGKIDLANIARFDNYERHLMFAYADSKLALVMLARELSTRLASTNITVNSFHPGAVNTNGNKNIPNWYIRYLIRLFSFIDSKSPLDGAQTMIYLTVSESVKKESGGYYADCIKSLNYHKLVDDESARKDLWELSTDLLKTYLCDEMDFELI